MFQLLILMALAIVGNTLAKHEMYEGYKAFSITPMSRDEQARLHTLSDELELDFLQHALVGRPGIAIVKRHYIEQLIQILNDEGFIYSIYSDDVKRTLEIEDEIIARHRELSSQRSGGKHLPFGSYHEFEVISAYMEEIAAKYPDTVQLVNGGTSFEGRPLNYLKISTTNFTETTKPVIFIDGGIHAREWIAPPTVAYAIHKLVVDITESDLVNDVDWIIHPVVNPDGYAYTHSTSRFWRKTRSHRNTPMTIVCPGVDGNRNYDYAWNTVGVSSSPCSDIYAGTGAFSEVETALVNEILHQYLDRMALYITTHSYGSMVLYPWGDTGLVPEKVVDLHRVGMAIARAIREHSPSSFPDYAVGNGLQVLNYGASGAAEDYAYYIGVPLAFTIELPGFGDSYTGFNPDPSLIEQIVKETWEGFVAGARMAVALYRKSRFWRKTRSTIDTAISALCPGVDGNRNFDYAWNTVGVSSLPCSDIYPGPSVFSEPETRLIRDIILEYSDRMALYLSAHSYGSMMLYPWGDTGESPEKVVDLHRVGTALAIRENSSDEFPDYAIGNVVQVLNYAASGSSADYAYAIGIPLAFTIELPGFGGAFIGFNPNPELIEQIVTETWEGIVAGARMAVALYRK